MKAMLTACAASICLGLAAAEVEWFDAGINSYTNFPGSGETLVVDGAGTWTNVMGNVTLTNNVITLTDEANVDFEFANKRAATESTTNTIIIVAQNIPLAGSLPEINDEVKGGIIPCAVVENDPAYYGITKDGETKAWVKLTGAVPEENMTATFKIDYWRDGEIVKVRYSVDNTVLTNGVAECFDVAKSQINKVSFTGNGDIAGLSGNVSTNFSANADVETAIVTLVEENKLYGTWLLKMAEGENATSVRDALDNGISQEALRACLLANVVPTNTTVKLEIPSFGFDANGNIIIGSSQLKVGDTEQGSHTINGTIRIYRAGSIAELNSQSTGDGRSLGKTVPVAEQTLDRDSETTTEFFQLRIEP